jgi:hypothetical protein
MDASSDVGDRALARRSVRLEPLDDAPAVTPGHDPRVLVAVLRLLGERPDGRSSHARMLARGGMPNLLLDSP